MTASLRFAPVSVVAPLDYVQIIWTTLIGWAFFATMPLVTTLAGAALITASGIYTAYRERVRRTPAPTS
jgi:drug/metabolite transporter (DMT)-like permease